GHHLQTNQPTAKLVPRCHGLFEVIQVMSPVNYWLKLPAQCRLIITLTQPNTCQIITQWMIHDMFHTDLLTPYHEMCMHGANYECPPPELVDGVEEYKVESIL
ncbi:hypothetical protein EI94DRAFT_1482521, partial [Lactarius quietus]